LSILRKHWLLLPLIFIELFWWRIVPLFLPPLINPEASLKDVDYWSIVTNPNWFYLAVFGFVVIGVLSLIQTWRIKNIIYRSLLIVAFLTLLSISTCADLILAEESEGRTIRNLATLEYSGKMFHLAESTNSHSRGVPEFDYLVFECDAAGKICSEIYKAGGYGYNKKPVQLFVDGDHLIFEWHDQTQILPAVNGSS